MLYICVVAGSSALFSSPFPAVIAKGGKKAVSRFLQNTLKKIWYVRWIFNVQKSCRRPFRRSIVINFFRGSWCGVKKKCIYRSVWFSRQSTSPLQTQCGHRVSTTNRGLWKLLFSSSSIASVPAVPSGDGMPQQQQQQPTPGAHDTNHGGSAKMNQLLDANYLGVHTLAVGQVKTTEFTRQINDRGLNKVKLSIKTKGWVNSNTPYVLVPREQLPSGKDTVFSPDLLRTLTVCCLDGNHRIQALLELEGAEFSVECRLYLHFDCAETINALARSEYSHHRFFVSSCHVLRPCVV